MDNLFKSFKNRAESVIENVKKKGGDIAQSIKMKPEEFFDAVTRDECETVKGSLKWAVFVNEKDTFGNSPLHIAAKIGSSKTSKILISWGARLNERDDEGATPLHRAAERGHEEVVQFYLSNLAEIGVADDSGATPLHLAAAAGHRSIVELLVSYGAIVNAKDYRGRIAADYARERGIEEIAQFLDNHGEKERKLQERALSQKAQKREVIDTIPPAGRVETYQRVPDAAVSPRPPVDDQARLAALKSAGRMQEAVQFAEEEVEISAQQGTGWSTIMWASELLTLYGELGQLDRMRQFSFFLVSLMRSGSQAIATVFILDAAKLYADAGDLESARRLLEAGAEIAGKDPSSRDFEQLSAALAKLERA